MTQEEWIAALAEAAGEARSHAGHADLSLRIGEHTIRIRVAPESMRSLLKPLAGLTEANGNGRTIDLWEIGACRVKPPRLPTIAQQAGGRGEIRWLTSPTTAGAWQEQGPMLLAWDARTATVSGWIGATESLPPWERAAPLRVALNWTLRGPGRALAHAAAVGRDGGPGLLIGGRGGSGKSTTALSWLLAGGDFAGDDYVLVDLGEAAGPVAAPIYATAKADDRAISMLPALAEVARDHEEGLDGKRVLDVRDLRPEQPAGPIRIEAIVIPGVAPGRKPVLRPVSRPHALRALAPSSLLQLPGESDGFRVLASLVRDLPCFELDLAPDPEANVAALERVIPA